MPDGRRDLARYQQLLDRADFELRMAQELVVLLKLPFKRVARLQRARREIQDESKDTARARARAREQRTEEGAKA